MEKISPEVLKWLGLYGQDRGRYFLPTDRANSVNKAFIICLIQVMKSGSWSWLPHLANTVRPGNWLCSADLHEQTGEVSRTVFYAWSMNEWSKFPSKECLTVGSIEIWTTNECKLLWFKWLTAPKSISSSLSTVALRLLCCWIYGTGLGDLELAVRDTADICCSKCSLSKMLT